LKLYLTDLKIPTVPSVPTTPSNETSTASGTGTAKSLTVNLDIKNYFSVTPANLDTFTKKVKQVVTDVLVDATRDASIIVN